MGLQQTQISVCNDGNVSQLDVTDRTNGGRYNRIEVYRCSQPSGGYGITASGSRVEYIAGGDHLSTDSNRVFRYTFSLGEADQNRSDLTSVLEGREEFNPVGLPDGSWEVRLRDIDPLSDSYGAILRSTVQPVDTLTYQLHFELRPAPQQVQKTRVVSPLHARITDLNPQLLDLGVDMAGFPAPVSESNGSLVASKPGTHSVLAARPSTHANLVAQFDSILRTLRHQTFSRFLANLDAYEEFGDFGAKPTHPGTNLIGPNAKLAAESIFVRQYRAALILLGRLSSPEMAKGAAQPLSLAQWQTNTRPGVYAIFVGAAINHIAVYKLGLDKVHSDYGGIPMSLAPGSRLENDATPVADAWRCNQTLGEVADIFYLSEPQTNY